MSSPLTRSASTSNTELTPHKELQSGSITPQTYANPTVADVEKSGHGDAAAAAAAQTPGQIRRVRGWKWFTICVAIYVSCFLYGLDNTIVADIQASIVDTYGEIEKLSWLGIGFPLGSIATILSL
jgi:hypothetical protein